VCQFGVRVVVQLRTRHLVEAIQPYGWDFSLQELMKVGERRLNLMRAFNAREESGRRNTMPEKLECRLRGPTDGVAVSEDELRAARVAYYALAGWDEQAAPSGELEELGLGWLSPGFPNTR